MTAPPIAPSVYPMTINGRIFTQAQANQLLYLETRAVDYGGAVASIQMNSDDIAISKAWADEGFLTIFGRILFDDLKAANRGTVGIIQNTHYVELSDEAWAAAAALRKARGLRTKRSLRA